MANVKSNLVGKEVPADLSPTAAFRLGLLTAAMSGDLLVGFNYDGKERLAEVHAVGRSTKDGKLVMRAYQVAGGSSRPLPAWALFRIDDMSSIGPVVGVNTLAPRPGYTMGDKQMDPVLCEIDLTPAGATS